MRHHHDVESLSKHFLACGPTFLLLRVPLIPILAPGPCCPFKRPPSTQLRREVGVTGQPESAVPNGGYDGTGLHHDCGDHALLLRLPRSARLRQENRSYVQAMLGAVVKLGPLRLWHACGYGGASGSR